MAGYRPKSLDELNAMYDQTLAAEKAIKKGTSLIEKCEERDFSAITSESTAQADGETKQSVGITDEINDFIAKFAYEKPAEEKPEEKPKPQMTVLVPEQPKTEKVFPEASENTVESGEAVIGKIPEPVKADRNDLMEEYMRIMNDDEDDEIPRKKLSRKEKKKLKMSEKRAAEKAETEKTPEELYGAFVPSDESQSADSPAVEIIVEEDEAQKDPFADESEEEFKAPEYVISDEPEEASEPVSTLQTEDEADTDFSFPEDYVPGWMEEDTEEEKETVNTESKKNAGNIILKAFLCVVLAVLVFVGSTATVFKTLVPVNTGKTLKDTFYFFTVYKDYPSLELCEGDLVITEKRYTEDGDVFAYVDYSNKTFEFGRRSDSITNDNGAVLLVTEKDGNRTLVSRDDCKGVIYAVYPSAGRVISILTDNYILVIAAVAVFALVIILILALALRNKDKSFKNNSKSKKNFTEDITEETEEEINLFSTIE